MRWKKVAISVGAMTDQPKRELRFKVSESLYQFFQELSEKDELSMASHARRPCIDYRNRYEADERPV
jgi:hypothetical protein